MPRIKPPPAKPETPEIEEYVAPTGAIEIDLPDEPGETQIELAPAPPPPPSPPEPPAEDNPLQKALDAQKRAEEMQRTAQRERDDALRRAQEREQELERERGGREDAEYNSVLTAIAAEQSAIDKAEADYAAYAASGDWASAGKAQRIMASASARLDRLEDGKQAFDVKRETPTRTTPPATATPPAPPAAPQDFEQRIAQMPEIAKGWLRKHPEFINDEAMNRKIGGVHNYLVENKGLQPFSEAYFDAVDTEFGFKAAPATPSAQPQRRSIPMSAPVSRDAPTYSGQKPASTTMTLTEEERRIARTSYSAPDMTDAQKEYAYAKNKQKLQRLRANGEYRQTTEQSG